MSLPFTGQRRRNHSGDLSSGHDLPCSTGRRNDGTDGDDDDDDDDDDKKMKMKKNDDNDDKDN